MDIRRYFFYLFIYCCLLLPFLIAKPVSLNKIIAEEQATSLQPRLKISEINTSIRKNSKEPKLFATKRKTTENLISTKKPQRNERISPLKYKKTFQIRAPLRPKKVKYLRKLRNRLKNTTSKREIKNNDKFNRNYIPLLKSLNILFNNILSSDSSEEVVDSTDEYARQQSISADDKCHCASKSRFKINDSTPPEEAIASPTSVSVKVSSKVKTAAAAETTTTTTDNTFDDNVRSVRRDKNLSLLLAGNTTSSRRNHNGFSERSLATYYRNSEGYISRDNGSYECNNTRGGKTISYTENNKDYPNSYSRNDASWSGSYGTIGRNRNNSSYAEEETPTTETDVFWTGKKDGRNGYKSKGKDKFETRRNQTESGAFLSHFDSRLRGYLSQEEATELGQIQDYEESIFSIEYNFTSNQRFPDGNGSVASQNQEFRRANKTVTLDDKDSINLVSIPISNSHQDKQKIVMIYDGYSIARDVNGNNVITEKAYRIHS